MSGYNPLGNDTGPLPPNWSSFQAAAPRPAPAPPPQQYYYAQPVQLIPTYAPGYPPPRFYYPPPMPAAAPAAAPPAAPPAFRTHGPPVNTTTPQPHRIQTSGHTNKPSDFPGLNLQNAYGGTGNPPGFEYLFHPKNSPIIFIRSGSIRPWTPAFITHTSNPANKVTLKPVTVPSNTTVKELLEGCGATNVDAKKNVVTEVWSQGNGRWKRGLCISGADERAEKKIADMGWDESRNGRVGGGGRGFTFLYVTSDTEVKDL